ncbi:uracil-DNA glycosylase [Beggiatoa alba]|nr:uracil-DNA glycosylase [bacterium AH-315-E07]MBN4082042.1 uracil-DNA glycosylase [Beggiatoa alba]
MSSRQAEYLNAMGIQRWQLRAGESMVERDKSLEESSLSAEVAIANETIVDDEREWWSLSDEVAACRQCELHQGRTQTVFGTGNQNADWLIIGEAPGADEDQQGEPFVGHAGQLLTQMILALGYEREQVYIANILKCRPPNDRDPLPDEVRCCEAYLKRQIALIQPSIIVAVGRVAAQNMLKTDAEISAIRGQTHHYGECKIPLVVTYHPAYLLRSPIEKSKAWQDLLLAKQIFQQA